MRFFLFKMRKRRLNCRPCLSWGAGAAKPACLRGKVGSLNSTLLEETACSFGYMPDEEVVHLAKGGHLGATEFLIMRYRPLVENKAKAYFVMGADREDVIQEGMIGLYKAIRDFRTERLNKFRPFAELCVTRQIITAVKTATRQKHVPLNGYVSLDRTLGGEPTDGSLLDVLPDQETESPDTAIFDQRLPQNLNEIVQNVLSELELGVLRCYLNGMSYREMSRELECHTKSIDNALQRVKRKVGILLKN
jgi:RNA polymerase sporulation-specific sigma factor